MQSVQTCSTRLLPDPARVVIRPFHIAPERAAGESARVRRIVNGVLDMDEDTVEEQLALVNRDFESRHWQTRTVFLQRFDQITREAQILGPLSETKKELIGAYFCHEYSYAAAALMNPSIVPHVDQTGLQPGSMRFILSLRAVGEGHISSIAFREGILSANGDMRLMIEPPFATAAHLIDPAPPAPAVGPVTVQRHPHASLSGTVIFPVTAAQRNGLEDLRLVRFGGNGDPPIYYGSYTAYSGSSIASELLVTRDFRTFELRALKGDAARNKGMALFPRKIGDAYAMIGRQDNERLFFLQSDDLMTWNSGEPLLGPRYPWEMVQIGNCGAPIELDEGWLLLTHGVGAMRKYSIGAALLDKNNPRKVLGRLPKPLLAPSDGTREGYVPNVVYTCGALVNEGMLFMPYGVADSSVAFARASIQEILSQMV